MASTSLTFTQGTPTNTYKYTISFWVKRSKLGVSHLALFTAGTYTSTNMAQFLFSGDDTLLCQAYNSSSTLVMAQDTNMKFRDTNGWYHIVLAVDTTQATASDRQTLYVNGEEITSLATNTAFPQNSTYAFNENGFQIMIGNRPAASYYFDGSMSHVHFIDGTVYDASAFGETDATTGNWKIKTGPSVTYGTNGFFILKDGNSLTDQSGNSNNFALAGGTLTKSEDCPDNVFTSFNPLFHDHANTNSAFTNGNTAVQPQSNGSYTYAVSTLGMPKGNGKFYFEAKYIQYDNIEAAVGIVDMDRQSELFYENRPVVTASNTTAIGRVILNADGHSIISGTANSSYGFGSWADNDIICMACDMENGAFYFRKNGGSWANSGNPESGSTKTGAIDISATSQWTSSVYWGIWVGDGASGGLDKFTMNFGDGYFGTTAVSSAGTNASGNGIFEYDVPAGYTALSTKGLNL